MTRFIGYARGNSPGGFLDLQVRELKAAGCKKVYIDTLGTEKIDRPGLTRCLKALHAGDTLMVWRLDRLGRSMSYLVPFLKELRQRNVDLKSLKQKNTAPPNPIHH